MVEVVATTPVLTEGGRLEYRRRSVVEWYVNTVHGMELGMDLAEPPRGAGPLVVSGRVAPGLSATLRDADQTVVYRQGDEHAFTFSGLIVTDAAGALLAARLEVAPGIVRIVVQDGGAVYPITIDPTTGSCPGAWCSDGDLSTTDLCTLNMGQPECSHHFDPNYEGQSCQWGVFCCPDGQYHADCEAIEGATRARTRPTRSATLESVGGGWASNGTSGLSAYSQNTPSAHRTCKCYVKPEVMLGRDASLSDFRMLRLGFFT